MIDNFEIIKPLLTFDSPDEFYFLQIIQRKKDFIENKDKNGVSRLGRNNNNRLVKAYYIYSTEQLDAYKPEIIKLCELFNSRAGINLNKRNQKDVTLKCLEMIAVALRKNNFDGISKIYNSACGKEGSTDKLWIVDLDKEDLENSKMIRNMIDYACQPSTIKVMAEVPSKNGLHFITKKFNREQFKKYYPNIEIHTNNPTNLYIP